mmetsp:Transcript_14738/g.22351  ORF Transcript_14738/g.22351 Transcript_14738/m.22351 type:complete len:570 (+) Transcript_14738:199-1908(+)|eukprot:CAMPEP_0167756950 /NCGR_PEP_ID=MMETSP0110_2-20121227/9662_1 /TAXON_ID=629695 /ORGANISM="Gymnochlora sp., Strain CCMP2014" /LENGTH=569 /DNA_ID=CAMNT_0007643101 /DNA_START=97 /DNA_END=1806 /DNA_ORIENTATION=+
MLKFHLYLYLFGLAVSSDLQWSDLNVVVVTDVHSWVSGHKHNYSNTILNADYGDLYSFWKFIKDQAAERNRDIFFVNDGDIVDGTGLSDATHPRGEQLTPILKMLPFDLVNTGNHELYRDESIGNILKPGGFADHFNGKYLTSNVARSSNGQTLGQNYTVLTGSASGRKYTAYGFLFNMQDHCPLVEVRTVEESIETPWFAAALEGTDAAIVLAHMDVNNGLAHKIRAKILALKGASFPVIFFTGHTHYRGYRTFDDYSVSFEAGHYFDTVGFLSMNFSSPPQFAHKDIDANVNKLAEALGMQVTEMVTPEGNAIKTAIQTARAALGLDTVLGCNPARLRHRSPSVWQLYTNEVVPTLLKLDRETSFSMFSTGGLRYDLFAGETTLDDIIVFSPFGNTFKWFQNVDGPVLNALKVNGDYRYFAQSNTTIESGKTYDLIVQNFDEPGIFSVLQTLGYSTPSTDYPTSLDSTTIWQNWTRLAWPCAEPPKSKEDTKQSEEEFPGWAVVLIVIIGLAAAAIPISIYYFAPCMGSKKTASKDSKEMHVIDQDSSIPSEVASTAEELGNESAVV